MSATLGIEVGDIRNCQRVQTRVVEPFQGTICKLLTYPGYATRTWRTLGFVVEPLRGKDQKLHTLRNFISGMKS